MNDWAEAAHDAAGRARKAQQATGEPGAGPPGRPERPPPIRTSWPVYDRLAALKREQEQAEQRPVTFDRIIERLLERAP